jgi:hypothetical protein
MRDIARETYEVAASGFHFFTSRADDDIACHDVNMMERPVPVTAVNDRSVPRPGMADQGCADGPEPVNLIEFPDSAIRAR